MKKYIYMIPLVISLFNFSNTITDTTFEDEEETFHFCQLEESIYYDSQRLLVYEKVETANGYKMIPLRENNDYVKYNR